MKNFLILLSLSCFAFALFSCSKDDRDKILGNVPQITEVAATNPDATIQEPEKDIIYSSDSLSSATYEIFEIRFSTFSVAVADNPEFTISNNLKFNLSFGIKNKSTGNFMYISASSASWSLNSDNDAIAKTDDFNFTVSSNFYNNKKANITTQINYKGLSNTFTFTLKSGIVNQTVPPFVGKWIYTRLLTPP